MSATSTMWSACTSAADAMLQVIGVRAKPTAPATAIGSGTASRRRIPITSATASAARSAEYRLARNAGSPKGARATDASQPVTT